MADVSVFMEYRPLLLGVAYRMLGSASEAEDLVQEAYLRWAAIPDGTADNPRAYLTTARTLRDSRWTAGLNAADFGSTPQLVKVAAGTGTGPVLWSPSGNDATPAAVKEAQSMGFQVIPWTINKQVDMTNLLRLGIDGIITDYPDVLRSVMRSQGLPMPLPAGPVN